MRNVVETIVGIAIVVVTVYFFLHAQNQANIKPAMDSYNLSAKFSKIDGIAKGSDIRIAGIKVGTVISQNLDRESYEAVLELNIDKNVKIPSDSSAAIVSEGLLGSKYVSIEPGADEEFLNAGDKIIYTQSSVNLETLIGKFMFKE